MSQKTALERIEENEKRIQQVEANSAGAYALAENVLQKLISLEQSYAAIAKTLHAVITTLKEADVISDEKVMENIRKLDDDQAKQSVAEMVQNNVIKSTDTVSATSLVVVKNVVIPTENPTPIVLSNYRLVEMPSQTVSAKLRDELAGKKVGDTVKTQGDGFEALYIVLEAYELAEMNKMGDNQENGNAVAQS